MKPPEGSFRVACLLLGFALAASTGCAGRAAPTTGSSPVTGATSSTDRPSITTSFLGSSTTTLPTVTSGTTLTVLPGGRLLEVYDPGDVDDPGARVIARGNWGSGEREFGLGESPPVGPELMAVSPDRSRIVVWDGGNRRLVSLDQMGREVETIDVRALSPVGSVVGFTDLAFDDAGVLWGLASVADVPDAAGYALVELPGGRGAPRIVAWTNAHLLSPRLVWIGEGEALAEGSFGSVALVKKGVPMSPAVQLDTMVAGQTFAGRRWAFGQAARLADGMRFSLLRSADDLGTTWVEYVIHCPASLHPYPRYWLGEDAAGTVYLFSYAEDDTGEKPTRILLLSLDTRTEKLEQLVLPSQVGRGVTLSVDSEGWIYQLKAADAGWELSTFRLPSR